MPDDTPMPEKSSFMRREFSKEDAVVQFLRPQIGGKISAVFDQLDRLVAEAETLVNLGIMLQPAAGGGKRFFVTPKDLRKSMDEFEELENIAVLGRQFLDALNYVTQRKHTRFREPLPWGKTLKSSPLNPNSPAVNHCKAEYSAESPKTRHEA